MESFGGSGMVVVGNGVRKKRSDAARRPRHDSHALLHGDVCGDEGHGQSHDNWDRMVGSGGSRSENKLKKLKLKVGGVTRTIHTKPTADFSAESGSSVGFILQENLILQDEIYGNNSCNPLDKRNGVEVKFKNLPKPNSSSQIKHVRKSKRVPKRRALDVGFSDDDDDKDEEIRYLERLKTPKTPGDIEDGKDYKMKRERVVFKVPKSRGVMGVSHDDSVGEKDCRHNSKSEKEFEDVDYVEEEEEQISEGECGSSKKKLKKGSPNLYVEGRNESIPTTRNRSLQSISGSIDLSNILSSNSKKKKEKLSEVEQQLKKAEAAQRRRMQSEKAAREAEAEAIRRILGQDSGRKKREEKMKKQRNELLQERATNALTLAANTVRWVNSPTGTIITFSEDIGLPSIFNPIPCSYPPAREKCAGPNCENAYKYRDSKSNLPLCSLQCYKAINRNLQPLVTC